MNSNVDYHYDVTMITKHQAQLILLNQEQDLKRKKPVVLKKDQNTSALAILSWGRRGGASAK